VVANIVHSIFWNYHHCQDYICIYDFPASAEQKLEEYGIERSILVPHDHQIGTILELREINL
jgi:hypothetical protein